MPRLAGKPCGYVLFSFDVLCSSILILRTLVKSFAQSLRYRLINCTIATLRNHGNDCWIIKWSNSLFCFLIFIGGIYPSFSSSRLALTTPDLFIETAIDFWCGLIVIRLDWFRSLIVLLRAAVTEQALNSIHRNFKYF